MSHSSWDLSPLYSSFDAWKCEIQKEIKEEYSQLFTAPFRAKKRSPKTIRKLLDLYFEKQRHLSKLYTWAHLFHDQETKNTSGKEALSLSMFALQRFTEAASWIEPSLVHMDQKQQKACLYAKELKPYRVVLERLFRLKPHTLNEKEEALLALSAQDAYTSIKVFRAMNDSDFTFKEALDSQKKAHTVTHGSFQKHMRSQDRALRESSFHSLFGTFNSFRNTLTETLVGQANRHVFEMKARNYSSCLEAALYPKNIPTSLYTTLIETVRSNLSPLHRYMKLRAKALKLKKLQGWDLYVPLIPNYTEPTYSYDEAITHTLAACKKLGKEYVTHLKNGLQKQQWVDVYEKPSKRSGAYSSGCYDSYPYILLNFKGLTRDISTLAHEAGHSMHSYFSRANQPYHQSEYEIFVAEVASTVNEELLSDLLISQAQTEEERLFLLLEQIENIRATFFRQTLFAEFELFLHQEAEKGTPITSDFLCQKYRELLQTYYGPTLEVSDELAVEWARIPHFYTNFYVYQYATGLSAAHAIKEALETEGAKAQKRYLHFLQSGASQFPIQLLEEAGVSMLTQKPYLQMIQHFSSLVELLELGLKKLALKNSKC